MTEYPTETILVNVYYWINMDDMWFCACFIDQAFKKLINICSDMSARRKCSNKPNYG